MPVVHEGTIYASRGYRSGPYLAIRTGGRGDVSASHVAWHVPTGAPYVSSIVHYQGLIYMATDNGILTIADASDGSRVWQGRVGGVFSASPVAGDGKVYLQSESGETIVLRAGRDAEIIARNTIGERTLASMAVASGRIFLRSDEHLFCIGPARQGR
jgi:outer membrane protein assembly factor BamB